MKANRLQTGTVFNIQKFSINDGPGIRTVVFLKGCPLRCRWCANPESQLPQAQILWDSKKCLGCRHCIDACPNQAIRWQNDAVIVDQTKCRHCKTCVKECPGHALTMEGETKTVQEVLDVVLQDVPFYEESGGGITLSGGEMLMQPKFAKQLYKASKEEGLHTACETTGYAKEEVFIDVIQDIDYLLFDLKHGNPLKHKEYTGVSNQLILQNMETAITLGKEVLPRIPVIPAFNSSLEDAALLARQLQKIGAKRVQLLPFHQFGENKYSLLNREYAYKNIPALHKEELIFYQEIFSDYGIDAFF